MPAAEITIGTISGEISSAMKKSRNGMLLRASPMAASVPSTVASAVEQSPMMTLLRMASSHCGFSAMSRYQRSENPSGCSVSILSVKLK